MQVKRHEAATNPSRVEELARVLDEMEPLTGTSRRLGFMHGQAIATADLKGDFVDDINAMFS